MPTRSPQYHYGTMLRTTYLTTPPSPPSQAPPPLLLSHSAPSPHHLVFTFGSHSLTLHTLNTTSTITLGYIQTTSDRLLQQPSRNAYD
jgi:hypothetical protein